LKIGVKLYRPAPVRGIVLKLKGAFLESAISFPHKDLTFKGERDIVVIPAFHPDAFRALVVDSILLHTILVNEIRVNKSPADRDIGWILLVQEPQ
jgi:hypothetical protein